jgi:anaerobic nitric oxide reductase flavorubredoxin
MLPVEIKPDIYWIGINDYTTSLFEGLWPISQEGVSYNSYLINDQKKAIIDLATEASADEILAQIREVTDPASLDYIILNHMEPDHTGVLPLLLNYASHATIMATLRASKLLEAFYGITDRIHVVEDGETLPLGKHTLQFVSTPNVHWPETMMTYEPGERILFSCDGFGGYGALHGGIFDDDYADLEFYKQEALRYYANIVATFSRPVLHAIEKLASVPVSIIAPSHGLVWRKDPAEILGLYRKWAEYNDSGGEVGVTLLYGSMYGNTELMMNAVGQGITREGVDVTIFNVTRTHVSYIMPYLWTRRGVMVGAPTYEGTLFPPMAQVLEMAGVKHIGSKQVARFGSYGWKGGGAQKRFEELIAPLKWELADVFEFNGGPTRQELHAGIEFGARFARRVKDSG